MRCVWGVLLSAIALAGCNPFEPKLYSVCEEVLKERLRSPSGYKRVEISAYENKMTIADWLSEANRDTPSSAGTNKIIAEGMERRGETPVRHKLYISYDAPNAYGTLVRGLSECTYVSSDGKTTHASRFNVKIDGKTNHERLMDAVKDQRG